MGHRRAPARAGAPDQDLLGRKERPARLPAAERGDFQAAQAAVAERPAFKGNVAFVKTRDFWEPDVEEMVNENVWRGPDWAKFYNVGSDRGYHYLGSGRIFYRMGRAFGDAMIELLPK